MRIRGKIKESIEESTHFVGEYEFNNNGMVHVHNTRLKSDASPT